jgi:hypothetical protein
MSSPVSHTVYFFTISSQLLAGLLSNASSKKFLTSLGNVLFSALDYGLSEDDEQELGSNLEKLIEDLCSADKDSESGDEGIEKDSDESSESGISLNKVLEVMKIPLTFIGCKTDHCCFTSFSIRSVQITFLLILMPLLTIGQSLEL